MSEKWSKLFSFPCLGMPIFSPLINIKLKNEQVVSIFVKKKSIRYVDNSRFNSPASGGVPFHVLHEAELREPVWFR